MSSPLILKATSLKAQIIYLFYTKHKRETLAYSLAVTFITAVQAGCANQTRPHKNCTKAVCMTRANFTSGYWLQNADLASNHVVQTCTQLKQLQLVCVKVQIASIGAVGGTALDISRLTGEAVLARPTAAAKASAPTRHLRTSTCIVSACHACACVVGGARKVCMTTCIDADTEQDAVPVRWIPIIHHF